MDNNNLHNREDATDQREDPDDGIAGKRDGVFTDKTDVSNDGAIRGKTEKVNVSNEKKTLKSKKRIKPSVLSCI